MCSFDGSSWNIVALLYFIALVDYALFLCNLLNDVPRLLVVMPEALWCSATAAVSLPVSLIPVIVSKMILFTAVVTIDHQQETIHGLASSPSLITYDINQAFSCFSSEALLNSVPMHFYYQGRKVCLSRYCVTIFITAMLFCN